MKFEHKSPFKLENTDEYGLWRENKLNNAKTNENKSFIRLKMTPPHFLDAFSEGDCSPNPISKQSSAVESIIQECNSDNYCLYTIEDYKHFNIDETKKMIHTLAKSCGLSKLDKNICADKDSLTSIHQTSRKGQHEYIPYTNKKLSWHTDGYYNLPENTINSMLLHCFQAANTGGESAFLDHEIAYILLRDTNPRWITALSEKDVMTIPANILNGNTLRPEQSGPVFSVTSQGRLHMRYTARQKNIVWDKSDETLEAVEYLQTLLNSVFSNESNKPQGSEYIVTRKFNAGEGILSRNILHCRSAYEEDSSTTNSSEQRLLFRGRFYDEIPSI